MTRPTRASVIIPLFNKAEFIVEAISSAIAQGPCVGEIIIIDDGSTDAGPSLVKDIAKRDARIRLISQPNGGVSSARNAGIRAAKEEIITFLDADDWYFPGYIDTILWLTKLHQTASMVCCGYTAFYPGNINEIRTLKPAGNSSWSGVLTNFYHDWSKSSFTCTNSIGLRRKTVLANNIQFPEGEGLGEDQDVWFRMAEIGDVVYRNEPLVAYRMDVIGSATHQKLPMDILPCYQRLFERLKRGEVPAHMVHGAQRLFASHLLNIANTRLQAGNTNGAWDMLTDPRTRSNPTYLAKSLVKYAAARLASNAITS